MPMTCTHHFFFKALLLPIFCPSFFFHYNLPASDSVFRQGFQSNYLLVKTSHDDPMQSKILHAPERLLSSPWDRLNLASWSLSKSIKEV
jgi:hypothetical protein